MSQRANPAVVGGFVVGALVLVVAGLLVFGSGALLRERVEVVAFFSGNVRGLQKGSAVEFRGVRVGTVTQIQLAVDPDRNALLIPVYMELDTGSVTLIGVDGDARTSDALPFLDTLVSKGLRARLDLKSFVTGQLAVGLDMHPETEVMRLGAVRGVYELPTVPSTLDRVAAVLQDLPLQDIASKLIEALDNAGQLLGNGDLLAALRDASAAAADARRLMASLQTKVEPLLDEAETMLRHSGAVVPELGRRMDTTLHAYTELARGIGRRLDTVALGLDQALTELGGSMTRLDAQVAPVSEAAVKALQEARGVLTSAKDLVAADSRTRYNLDATLEELAAAARSLRLMADYLVQNPDALLKGRGR